MYGAVADGIRVKFLLDYECGYPALFIAEPGEPVRRYIDAGLFRQCRIIGIVELFVTFPFLAGTEDSQAFSGQTGGVWRLDLEDGADLAVTQHISRYAALFGVFRVQPLFKVLKQSLIYLHFYLLDPGLQTKKTGCLLVRHVYRPQYFPGNFAVYDEGRQQLADPLIIIRVDGQYAVIVAGLCYDGAAAVIDHLYPHHQTQLSESDQDVWIFVFQFFETILKIV